MTLSGNSTYTGATAVDAGELQVAGSLGDTDVTVAGGARLGGTGSIAGAVTVQNGGRIAPGPGPGSLGSGDLVLAADSTFQVELNTLALFDSVDVTGTVDLTDALLDVLMGYDPPEMHGWIIVNNDDDDAITGTFKDLPEGVPSRCPDRADCYRSPTRAARATTWP